MVVDFIEIVKVLLSFVILMVLTIQDVKDRLLSDVLVYFYVVSSIILYCLSTIFINADRFYIFAYTFISLVTLPGLFFALYKTNLIGDGDFYVSLALGFLFPYPVSYNYTFAGSGILPPSFTILFHAVSVNFMYILLNMFTNMRRISKIDDKLALKYRILLSLLGRPVKISDILERRIKHFYFIQYFEIADGRLIPKIKLLSRGDEFDESKLRSLVETGYLDSENYVWITPGLPFILFLFIGFILTIILGDKPIVYFTKMLLRKGN